MTRRTRPARNVRFTLVFAALLHVLGGDFGAWLHAYYSAPAIAATTAAPGDERGTTTPAHSADCAVCQSLGGGTPVVPPAGTLFRVQVASFAPAVAPTPPAPRSRPVPPTLPRGPPQLS